jgi:uncharacterized protein with beta-barrel porin domain
MSTRPQACLLALPAALSLASPVAAQSLISGDHSGVLSLAAYGPGAVNIAAGASLTSTGWVGVWDSAPALLTNAGNINAAAGDGVYLAAGGSLSNSGIVGGARYGVLATAPASVANSGKITAGWDGVSLNDGGTVSNTGSLFGGHMGVYTGGAAGGGVVLNAGTITSRTGTAVSLYTGGTLTNMAAGVIAGGYNGAYAGGSGSRIANAGVISGAHAGVYLTGASVLENTGSIVGGTVGVVDMGYDGEVVNDGVITGQQIGVRMLPGGTVDNTGTITGGTLGVELARGGTLTDTGTIIAPTAIDLVGKASTVVLGTGAQINGTIAGNGTASQISLTGTGTLTSDITGLESGGALTIAPAAAWTGGSTWDVAHVVNGGIFTPQSDLVINGDFTQLATGTLRIAVTPTAVTPLTVNGTVTLAGTLVYVLAPGSYKPGTQSFLTATGGVSGAFTLVMTDMGAPMVPTVGVTKAPSTPVVAQTLAVQTIAVQTVAAPVVSVQTVITQSFTVAPQDGTLFPALGQALGAAGLSGAQALLDHDSTCTLPVPGTGEAAHVASALASGFCAAGGWVQGGGESFTADGAYQATGGGVLAGLDRPVATGGRLGVAVGYGATSLKDNAGGKGGFNGVRLGLYAVQPLGSAVLSAGVMDGLNATTSTRATGEGYASGKTNANVLSVVVELAAPFTLDGTAFTPAAGLRVVHVAMGHFSEQAATQAFAVTATGGSYTAVQPYLRLNLGRQMVLGNGLVFAPALSLGVSGTSGLGAHETLTAADGTVFTVTARHLAPVAGEAGVGFTLGQGNWRLHAAYSAQVAGDYSDQTLQAGIVVRF